MPIEDLDKLPKSKAIESCCNAERDAKQNKADKGTGPAGVATDVTEQQKDASVAMGERQSWTGIANINTANQEEINEAGNIIKEYRRRTGNLDGGNYGYVEGKIGGKAVENRIWRSGVALEWEPQIFTAIEVTGKNGLTWLRNTDSEYKMLNKLASDLGAERGGEYPNVTGELKIVSEHPFCTSCQGRYTAI